jgi:hypothetical protein
VQLAGEHAWVAAKRVDRLTDTQVVLEGDRRFRRADLTEIGDGHDGQPAHLRPMHDRLVVDALARSRLARLRQAINMHISRMRHDSDAAVVLELLGDISGETVHVQRMITQLRERGT